MKWLVIPALCIFIPFSAASQSSDPIAIDDTVEVMSQVQILIDVLANDYDPDGTPVYIKSINDPKHGTSDTIDGKIQYRSEHYAGMDSIRYRIKDVSNDLSLPAFARITVFANPDEPFAVADTFELLEQESYQLHILDNDFDPNGDELRIRNISSISHCIAIVSEDSSFVTVIPQLGGSWGDFEYENIERNTPGRYTSNKAGVYFTISANPDIPVPADDEAMTTGGYPVIIPVLDNDIDPQGEEIEIMDFTQPYRGSVTLQGSDLVYLPEISFTGVDYFSYRIREINDSIKYSYYARIYVTVAKNPDCPVGVADFASGMTYVPMLIDVVPNDTDINGDPLELSFVAPSGLSEISIEEGKIRYKSSSLTLGADTIYYKVRQVNDPLYYSESTPVYIDLAVNPDLPVTFDDYVTARPGVPLVIRPIDNDLGNASQIRLSLFGHQGKGQVAGISDSSLLYMPYFSASGMDSIDYLIVDNDSFLIRAEGQIFVNLLDQYYYDSLEINNINAGVNADGILFSKSSYAPAPGGSDGVDPHFRFPIGGMKNTIFTSLIWIGGLDAQENLHLAGERYKQVGIDFQAGPVANEYDTNHYIKYGRTWKISREEVEYHIENFGNPGYQPIEPILSWPGNGDPSNGESEMLAPFADINQDGIYDPMGGDYPLIRGDQTVFIMYNDDMVHSESLGERLKIEVHAMIYGFDEPGDTVLNNTVFVHYDLINRSDITYHDTYTGVFTDIDLGYAWDDYVRCDVTRGSFYGYNGRETDGNGEPEAYGENPPAQSVTVLAGPFMDTDGNDNPSGLCDEGINGQNFGNGIIDDERLGLCYFIAFNNSSSIPGTSDPNIAQQYYNLLHGYWKDSTGILYGGMGHQNDSAAIGPLCRFMFPGDTDPLNWGTGCEPPNGGFNQEGTYWTEETSLNVPGDRRGLGSMGPFTFHPGDTQEIELAFSVAYGSDGPQSSLNQLMKNIDSLIFAVEEGCVIIPNEHLGFSENKEDPLKIDVYPNPSSALINVDLPAFLHKNVIYTIYDIRGVIRLSGNINSDGINPVTIQDLNPGFYFIIIKSGEKVYTGRFVKL